MANGSNDPVLDVLLLSGGSSVISVNQGTGITSAVNNMNRIVDTQNHRNEISIASKNNLITVRVNGILIGEVVTSGQIVGQASIYGNVLGQVMLPGFSMKNDSVSLIGTKIIHDATVNIGPIQGSEIVIRIDTQHFESLDVNFSYPLKISETVMDLGLRIGFEDIELLLIESIQKYSDDTFRISSESLFPSVQALEQYASPIFLYDQSGDNFVVSLVEKSDHFIFTVNGRNISLPRSDGWGEVSYIEFFVNSERKIIDDNSAYFVRDPFVNLTHLNIWSE